MTDAALITGLHHVTAFASDPLANVRFYTRSLGLRLVKRTVNFDDPTTYHLYYGDAVGSPGTLLTHFPQPRAARARHGTGEIAETILAGARGSLGSWRRRLAEAGVEHTAGMIESLGIDGVTFADPDGMQLAIVEGDVPEGALPVERAVLRVPDAAATLRFLADALGFVPAGSRGAHHDLALGAGGVGQRLTVVHDSASPHEPMAAGTVHHIAWRVPDADAQRRAAERVRSAGVAVTPVMDRQYFRSIYFRIPGGIVFEIATDGPGFDVDESRESLGTALKLPPQYERRREEISRQLVPLST